MHARAQNDRLAYGDVHRVRKKICDYKHIDVVPCERLAQDRLSDLVFVLKCADLVDEVALVTVRKRIAMCKENCIVVIYRRKQKRRANK